MVERRSFGRRGTVPEPGASDRGASTKPRAVGSKPPSSLLPDGADMVARTRKRTLGLSLATAGALTAAGLWFAESGERTCVDDPTTPTVDESKIGGCGTTRRHSTGGAWLGHWFWRGGGSSWGGSSFRAAPAAGPISSGPVKSTASRGGFGSTGSFHLFGGS